MAFILAHEMGHVIRGHAIERIVTNTAVSVASRAAPVRGALGGWLKTVGIQYLQTAYSRDQELEADRLGVRLLRAAGFDPEGAIQLLTRLAELKQSAEPASLGEYFSTHPTAEIRIQSLRRFLAARERRP
jgi:predicted Zn-dependent protease